MCIGVCLYTLNISHTGKKMYLFDELVMRREVEWVCNIDNIKGKKNLIDQPKLTSSHLRHFFND